MNYWCFVYFFLAVGCTIGAVFTGYMVNQNYCPEYDFATCTDQPCALFNPTTNTAQRGDCSCWQQHNSTLLFCDSYDDDHLPPSGVVVGFVFLLVGGVLFTALWISELPSRSPPPDEKV